MHGLRKEIDGRRTGDKGGIVRNGGGGPEGCGTELE